MNKIINLVMMTFCFTLFLGWEAKDPKSLGIVVGVGQIAIAQVTNSPITTNKIPETDLNTPPAVSANERMKTYPSKGEYVAFSLNAAIKQVKQTPANQNYRTLYPEVYNLGGINQIYGLVIDQTSKDIILVGKYNPEREPITLDDLAVALRSRFIHGKWPVVSIDPNGDLQQKLPQIVRFEGGIQQTQFGADFLDADYRMKKISFGLLPAGIPDFKTGWDFAAEDILILNQRFDILSRLWFYPVTPSVLIREDVVSIKGLKVGVFTEVLAASINGQNVTDLTNFHATYNDKFAEEFSQRFTELSLAHPSLSRLQGLLELVAVSKALEEMPDKPDLSFWLREYQIKQILTQKTINVVTRKGESFEFFGGVQLRVIALRLNSGDVSALKEAVLVTKPRADSLAWTFIVAEWVIPTSPGAIAPEDIALLFTQAQFLSEQNRHDEAIAIYNKMLEIYPNDADIYLNRGFEREEQKDYQKAIADYNQAINLNPNNIFAYTFRGGARINLGDYQGAIADFNQAINLNPYDAFAYINRGLARDLLEDYQGALADYNQGIKLNPNDDFAYFLRGNTHSKLGDYQGAIADFNQAIKLNPNNADAYIIRGNVLSNLGDNKGAIADFNQAININPNNAEAYKNRGFARDNLGDNQGAIADYSQAIKLDPNNAEAYRNRGFALSNLGDIQGAIADFNQAINLNPNDAFAYSGRGLASELLEDYTSAIEDYQKAAQLYKQMGLMDAYQETLKHIQEILGAGR
ncbi:tetratricopeptide repeat protein [Microcystis aeruginosa BLCCF158]|uniref:Tetratricopeptide repeat protein n=1 Tax=Microcystis aeruginosa BLCC-F158 TaxID=2755316 RepID=A0A841V5Q5_MICAE|nr:tetratricopeptide repeat protein [Microcystis aeruginosa]MBC1197475.1 tetratricopeptide repeat protein [Microcystis aeruginosa BLCC-F158]